MSTTIPSRTRRRVRVHQNEGTVTKGKIRKEGKEVVSSEESVERFVGVDEIAPAYITIGGRVTKSLGNYESVQINVSVTLPCPPTEKDIREMREIASSMVDEFMDIELQAVEESR